MNKIFINIAIFLSGAVVSFLLSVFREPSLMHFLTKSNKLIILIMLALPFFVFRKNKIKVLLFEAGFLTTVLVLFVYMLMTFESTFAF